MDAMQIWLARLASPHWTMLFSKETISVLRPSKTKSKRLNSKAHFNTLSLAIDTNIDGSTIKFLSRALKKEFLEKIWEIFWLNLKRNSMIQLLTLVSHGKSGWSGILTSKTHLWLKEMNYLRSYNLKTKNSLRWDILWQKWRSVPSLNALHSFRRMLLRLSQISKWTNWNLSKRWRQKQSLLIDNFPHWYKIIDSW